MYLGATQLGRLQPNLPNVTYVSNTEIYINSQTYCTVGAAKGYFYFIMQTNW